MMRSRRGQEGEWSWSAAPAPRLAGTELTRDQRRGSGSRSRLVRRATRSSLPCARALTRERERGRDTGRDSGRHGCSKVHRGFVPESTRTKAGTSHNAPSSPCRRVTFIGRTGDAGRRGGEREDYSLLSLIYVGLRTYGKNLFSTRTVYRSSTALYRNLLLPSPQKIPF